MSENKIVVSYDGVSKLYAFKNVFNRVTRFEINGLSGPIDNFNSNVSIVTMSEEPVSAVEYRKQSAFVGYKHNKTNAVISSEKYNTMKEKLIANSYSDDYDDVIFGDDCEEEEVRYTMFTNSWSTHYEDVEVVTEYEIEIVLKPVSEHQEIKPFASMDAREITSTICKLNIDNTAMLRIRDALIHELDPDNIKMWNELQSFRFAKRGGGYWLCPEKYKQVNNITMIGSYYDCVFKRLEFIDEIRVALKETLLQANENAIGDITSGMIFERLNEIKKLATDIDVKVGSQQRNSFMISRINQAITLLMDPTEDKK